MKKTEFFTAKTPGELQLNVNSWLTENKDIGVIDSGMSVMAVNAEASYNFYLLYEAMETATAVAISAQLENVIPEGGLTETATPQLQ